MDAAFASFEEDVKGKLAKHYLADFVLINKDITSIPPEDIWSCSIKATVVGGKVVYNGEPLDFHGHTMNH